MYTALYDERLCGEFVAANRVHTSFLQHVPLGNRVFRALAPFYPAAFESFDLSAYNLVVSSTTAWAKGVRTAPGAVHVCYINTPSRFLFAQHRRVGREGPHSPHTPARDAGRGQRVTTPVPSLARRARVQRVRSGKRF